VRVLDVVQAVAQECMWVTSHVWFGVERRCVITFSKLFITPYKEVMSRYVAFVCSSVSRITQVCWRVVFLEVWDVWLATND